jgi:hypothetical protein
MTNWVGVLFLVLYMLVFLFISGNIIVAILQRHKFWSFATGFSLSCLAWTALRVTFWVCRRL